MKDKQCELIRRELEELTLKEEFSAGAAEHLRACAGCREFERQQTKLRQIVGSLGTVNAPADFDFRLRARLAADSQPSGFHYWSFAVKGLATAAILVVFGVAVAVLWQRGAQQATVVEGTRNEQTKPDESKAIRPPAPEITPTVAANNQSKRKIPRPAVSKPKRSVAAVDFSSERANVITTSQPALDGAAAFPIETSLQSVRVSLDDGHGNARIISFPTVTFGSQRVPVTGNPLAPKGGIW